MSFRGRQVIAGVLLATIGPSAFSADIQPGLWELVMENRIAAALAGRAGGVGNIDSARTIHESVRIELVEM